MADAVRRGRHMHGSRHYRAKITEQQAREIIALLAVPGTTQQSIADRYGISRSSVSLIKSGRNWKHLSSRLVVPA